jgi:Spy/CpxP family protein refolding chaperone
MHVMEGSMRKTMMAMGLGLALTVGAAGANAQATTKPDAGRHEGGRGAWQKGKRGGEGFGGRLLKGITLTDAQKAQLKEKREANAPQQKAFREQMRTAFGEMRAAREHGDSAAMQSARSKMEQLRKQGSEVRERQLADLRSILTADQRAQLDKNLAEAKTRMEQRRAEGGREGRGHRDGGR